MKVKKQENSLNTRQQIRQAGLTQRQIAKILNKYPQQVYDAIEGYNNKLLKEIHNIINIYLSKNERVGNG